MRAALISDASAIARLHAQSWRIAYRGILSDGFLNGPLYENRLAVWRQRLRVDDSQNQLVLLEREGDCLSGFVCARLDADLRWGALLDNLHVHPDHRGRGLGRRLVAAAAKWVCEQRPRSALYLWVYEANSRARAFYDSLGGVAVESLLMPAADGGRVQTLRYVWRELDQLQIHRDGFAYGALEEFT